MKEQDKALIGILECGQVPDALVPTHGDYLELYASLLGRDGVDYVRYAVYDGELPESTDAADGFLISGSRHGAYEDHLWIPPLEQFLRDCYQQGRPLVGICFGHQILAQALGGKVQKFDGGWSVGRVEYELDPRFGISDGRAALHAFHQDQVVELPPGATLAGSSDFCRIAALVYNDQTVSLQPHPEFSDAYEADLTRAKADVLPAEVHDQGLASIGPPTDRTAVGAALRQVLLSSPRKSS